MVDVEDAVPVQEQRPAAEAQNRVMAFVPGNCVIGNCASAIGHRQSCHRQSCQSCRSCQSRHRQSCHGRARPGHPRLAVWGATKSWMAGASPAMTRWCPAVTQSGGPPLHPSRCPPPSRAAIPARPDPAAHRPAASRPAANDPPTRSGTIRSRRRPRSVRSPPARPASPRPTTGRGSSPAPHRRRTPGTGPAAGRGPETKPPRTPRRPPSRDTVTRTGRGKPAAISAGATSPSSSTSLTPNRENSRSSQPRQDRPPTIRDATAGIIDPHHALSNRGAGHASAAGSRPAITLSTRRPSISSTSNRQPPNTIRSPTAGTRRSSASSSPASV